VHRDRPVQGATGLQELSHREQHVGGDVRVERDLAGQGHQCERRVRRRHLRVAHQGREVVVLHVRYPVS
jgi:hypothetical protein